MSWRATQLRRGGAKILCVVLSLALAPGCATTRPIAPGPGGYQESLRPGDQIRVVTHDGAAVELTVGAVTRDAIVGLPAGGGAEVAIPFWSVAMIERTAFGGSRTAGLVVGIGAAVVAALAVVAFVVMLGFMTSWGGRSDRPPHAGPAPAGG